MVWKKIIFHLSAIVIVCFYTITQLVLLVGKAIFSMPNCFQTDVKEYFPIQNATQRAGELGRLNERVGPLHGMTLAIKDNIAVAGTWTDKLNW